MNYDEAHTLARRLVRAERLRQPDIAPDPASAKVILRLEHEIASLLVSDSMREARKGFLARLEWLEEKNDG